jgi:outer membrane protein
MMNDSRMTAFVLVLALAASAADAGNVAAQTSPPKITFEQAIQIALRQNADILRAENATVMQEAAVTRQKLQFLPDLRLSTQAGSSVGRSFSQDEGAIVSETTRSLNAGISSSVTLFDGMRNVANLRSAQQGVAASEYDLERARQTVVMNVAANLLAVVQAEEQLRVRQEALAAQQAELQQIQAFVAAGKRAIADLYQQQASVAASRAAVVEAERVLGRARIDVIETLQLDPVREYDFEAPAIPVNGGSAPAGELDALIARALQRRVDLDAAEARERATEQTVRAAAGSRWPTVTLSGSYNTGATSASALTLRSNSTSGAAAPCR